MKLYAVTILDVCPTQCVTVTDDENHAHKMAAFLNANVSPHATIEEVDSFWPAGMTEADQAWLEKADAFRRQEGA